MYLLLNWQLVCRMREMQGFRVWGLNGKMNGAAYYREEKGCRDVKSGMFLNIVKLR